MAGASLTVDFNDGGLGELLRRAADSGGDLREPLALSGDVFENSTRNRFREGHGPGGIPWPISNRAKADGGSTLIDKGLLSTGITSEVSGNSVTTGVQAGSASSRYAATHQFGATILPVKGAFLVFNLPGVGLVFARKVVIPARPFLGIDADDVAALEEVWTEWMQGLFDAQG